MGLGARARTAMTRTAAAERGIAHDATRLQERRAVGARAHQPAAVADGNQDEDGDRHAGGEGQQYRQTDRRAGAQTDRYWRGAVALAHRRQTQTIIQTTDRPAWRWHDGALVK